MQPLNDALRISEAITLSFVKLWSINMSKTAKKTASKKTARKTAAKKTSAANARHPILDTHTITVVKKDNPFTGEVQVKHANAVLKCNGKTVADAKKAGADSWTVRELAKRGHIKVVATAAA